MNSRIRSFRKTTGFALNGVGLFLAALAGAQAADPQQVADATAPVVTVTATRTDHPIEDVPATVSVIGETEMERNLVKDIPGLIRYEPGVSVGNNPGRFGANGFTIRGIGGNRVLMQVDGIRLPDSFSVGDNSSASRNMVDLDALKSVEILRGPSSSLYGSDAIGGVVSYITKDPEDYMSLTSNPAYGSIKTGYASADQSWFGTATVAAGHGDLQGMLVYTYRNGSETETRGSVGGTGPSRTEANPQSYDDDNLLAKITYRLDADNTFKITGEHFRSDTSTNVLSLSATVPTQTYLAGEDKSQRDRLSFEHEHRDTNGLLFQVARWHVYYQDGETTQDTKEIRSNSAFTTCGVPPGPPPPPGTNNCTYARSFDFEQKIYGLGTQFEKVIDSGAYSQTIVYGLDASQAKTEEIRNGSRTNTTTGVTTNNVSPDVFPVRDFPVSDTLMVGVFAQDEFKLGALSIVPGLRYDYYKLKPKPDDIFTADNPGITAQGINEDAWSPKLGLVYRLTPAYTLFGQYSYGFRAPPYADVNLGFTNLAQGYTSIPNDQLKPEKSRGVEGGLRGNFGNKSFGITGFYTRYTDFIDSQHALTCPGDPLCVPGLMTFQSVNLRNVRISGVELRGEAAIGYGFGVTGALAYARGTDTDRNQPINSIDPLKFIAGLRYDAGTAWGGQFTGTFVERKNRIDTTTTLQSSPSFAIFDLTAYWNVTKQISFNAGFFNITDQKYFLWSDLQGTGGGTNRLPGATSLDRFSQPGRNGAITFKYQFI